MRHSISLCLALLLMAANAGAQSKEAKPAGATATAGTPTAAPATKKPTTARKPARKGTAAKKSPAAKRSGETSPPATTTTKPETRTLQDIHIEGEIPVPQVLFITARDQRRFVDFQHQRYLKTSQEVGRATALPSRLVVTGEPQADPTKETRP